MKSDTKIICLTPVKNEEWIFDKFLRAANLWADKIIVVYQESNDNTLLICKKFKKVVVVKNKSVKYDELERQNLLIKASRKIFPNKKHILISLDADEFLTLNNKSVREFESIKMLKRGTVIKFKWNNVKLKDNSYWEATNLMPFGFIDDGSKHTGYKIHSPRIPMPAGAPIYCPKFIQVMHYQYADWERMKSKHRWYQCWETINNSNKNAIDIYRQYHHMFSISKNEIKKIPKKWYKLYKNKKIHLDEIRSHKTYWWDQEVVELLRKFGTKYFSKLDIWEVCWNEFSKNNNELKDPRNFIDRIVNYYLVRTQPYVNSNIRGRLIMFGDFILKRIY